MRKITTIITAVCFIFDTTAQAQKSQSRHNFFLKARSEKEYGLKTGVENGIFWSGFGEPCGTPSPEISRSTMTASTPPPPPATPPAGYDNH